MSSRDFTNVSLVSPTQGFLLRNPVLSDVDDLINLLGNPETVEMDANAKKTIPSAESIVKLIEKFQAAAAEKVPGRINLAVVDIASEKVIGLGGYGHIENSADGKRVGDAGIMLLPEVRGRGIGTEAMRMAIRFGFDEVGMDEVTVSMEARNLRMRKIMETVLKWEGKEHVSEDGVQEMIYKMTKAEWAEKGGI
jgi:ribosomal-protein-alanine N-acetyltransferase